MHYANLNSSSINKLFLNCGPLNMLFRFCFFFQFLIYVCFNEAFFNKFMKKLSFFNTNFQNWFQDLVCYRILGCQTLWYWNDSTLNIRQNLEKTVSFFGSKIAIFDIFFKRLNEENFQDLQINKNWKFQVHSIMSHKITALESFCKFTQKSFFNS